MADDVQDSPRPHSAGDLRRMIGDTHRVVVELQQSHKRLCDTVHGPEGEPRKGMVWKLEKLVDDENRRQQSELGQAEERKTKRSEGRAAFWTVAGMAIFSTASWIFSLIKQALEHKQP